jgi:hypothetical protein
MSTLRVLGALVRAAVKIMLLLPRFTFLGLTMHSGPTSLCAGMKPEVGAVIDVVFVDVRFLSPRAVATLLANLRFATTFLLRRQRALAATNIAAVAASTLRRTASRSTRA